MLQKASLQDKQAVRELYNAAKSVGAVRGNTTWGEDYPDDSILTGDLSSGSLYVEWDGERAVCAVTLLAEDRDIAALPVAWGGKKPAYLSRLCVHPDLQNQHKGEAIVLELADIARELGYDSLCHVCNFGNPAAFRLYTRMGYQPLGDAFVFGAQHYIFEKLLKSDS